MDQAYSTALGACTEHTNTYCNTLLQIHYQTKLSKKWKKTTSRENYCCWCQEEITRYTAAHTYLTCINQLLILWKFVCEECLFKLQQFTCQVNHCTSAQCDSHRPAAGSNVQLLHQLLRNVVAKCLLASAIDHSLRHWHTTVLRW